MFGTMDYFYLHPAMAMFGFTLAIVWSVVWNGLGFWHAAKNNQKSWFIVMLIVNSLGLIPIIYLIWFKPREEKEDEEFKQRLAEQKAAELKKSAKKKKRK